MSAVPHHSPHVRELFVKNGAAPLGAGSFEKADKEPRKSYDISGKKKRHVRGQQPSSGLGQYKPKILSRDNTANIPVNHDHSSSSAAPVHPSQSRRSWYSGDTALGPSASDDVDNGDGAKSKPFIIGDKDVPLVLHPSPDTNDLEFGVSDLSLTTGRVTREDRNIGTENPLFSRQEASGNVQAPNSDIYSAFQDAPVSVRNGSELEPNGVFIPAPDYDEEEKTLVFTDEPDDDDDEIFSGRTGKKVYREYHGEDFSQYLSDEESEMFTVRSTPKRPSHHVADRKSQTEAKRHYKKREAPQGKSKAKDKSSSGSNSLRNFSFSDSKFGSVNGSSRRLSVHSLSEDVGEAELFMSTGFSYEQFLRSKNGEDLGDLLIDNPPSPEDKAGYKVPSRYARGPSHKKDTLWKKLTWKFKKQPKNSFDLRTS